MKGIKFSIHALEPILATSFQGDPNSDVSYSYIPGSMIRGAVIGRYLRHYQLRELDLNDTQVQQLFFDETKTLYLNAYLESNDEGKRTLPVPLSWFKDKDASLPKADSTGFMQIYDRAIEYDLSDEENITLKNLEQKFCTLKRKTVTLYSEKRRINIHNFRNRQKGTATKEQGEIFRYDALDSEQTFQTAILCKDPELIKILQKLLPESANLWLGGSQSAGYGKTEIRNIQQLSTDWCEIEIKANKRFNHEKLTITLLSDTILRDQCGQVTANAHLIKLELEEILSHDLPNVKIYANSIIVGGFNRKWGLPLPQVPALSAGSVVVFEDVSLTSEQIEHLEFFGIGERRNEGYGRVAINWTDEAKLSAIQPNTTENEQVHLESTSQNLANLILDRIYRQRLEKQLMNKLGEADTKIINSGSITNSQLSRLLLVAIKGLSNNSFDTVKEFLNPENLTKKARDQLQSARMDNGNSLYDTIQNWLNTPKSWITNPQDVEVILNSSFQRNVNDETGIQLVNEYTLRLIMATAKRAMKEKN
ncbi:hypothetical protein [Chroococcus sp. FPU101]|uniref:hypothetical protein n=1 Tax=Chroococcus sp. FPU101 TaxID=1974212 RepID=UPI001A8EEEEC|nr:hypothetical protein [Chroococcus sp. FPU101]GFE68267.1 CRISPR-associated RAMP protein Csx10 [Chroococcus sp. FPU101]